MNSLNQHKTKIFGALLVLFGYAQLNITSVQKLVSPDAFGWITFSIGAAVVVLGFLNSEKDG